VRADSDCSSEVCDGGCEHLLAGVQLTCFTGTNVLKLLDLLVEICDGGCEHLLAGVQLTCFTGTNVLKLLDLLVEVCDGGCEHLLAGVQLTCFTGAKVLRLLHPFTGAKVRTLPPKPSEGLPASPIRAGHELTTEDGRAPLASAASHLLRQKLYFCTSTASKLY
jgi:hypothetical protein